MGRRKKETLISYKAILSTSYVKQSDYTQAQIDYSNNLANKPNQTSTNISFPDLQNKNSELDLELLIEDEDLSD